MGLRLVWLLLLATTIGTLTVVPVYSDGLTFAVIGLDAYQPITFSGQVTPSSLDFVFIFVFSGTGCDYHRQIISQLTRADGSGAYSFKLNDGLPVGDFSAHSFDVITGVFAPCMDFQIVLGFIFAKSNSSQSVCVLPRQEDARFACN